MARKRLTIDKWYGGISNDPSVGGTGSFHDGRGVEIRKDSKKFKLSSNYSADTVLNNRANGYTVGAIIPNATESVIASRDGRLSSAYFATPAITNGSFYVDGTHTAFYNLFQYTGAGDYGVVIAGTGILRWAYSGGTNDLGTLEDSVVTNGDMSSATGWTVGTNWSFSSGLAEHTAGSTQTLTQTLTVDNATKYIVNVFATVTAGSVVVSMGGSNLGTITTAETNVAQTYSRTTAGVSEAFTFTPSNDFVGSINYGYVQKSNVTLALSKTFSSSDAVVLAVPNYLYIGNGDTLTRVDTSLSTWSSVDPVTIAKGFTIKGLSKVGDQIFIYASDGSMSKQYVWDGFSSTPAREITWYDKPISRIVNLNNIDYLIVRTTLRSSLYVVNGYQPELIFQSGNIQNSSKDRLVFEGDYINGIETIGSRILIPTTGGLYSFGNFSPGYPKSLNREYTWNGGIPTTSYYSEASAYQLYTFHTSTKSGSTKNYVRAMYQNEEASGDDYSIFDPGFIKIHPFFGTSGYSQRKASVAYKIGAKIPTGTYVNLYSRTDDATGYANFYTDYETNPITTLPTVGAVYTNGSNTYTVTAVTTTKAVASGSAIIHCTYTGSNAVNYTGTLTKTGGTGDSTVVFFRSNEFQFLKTFSNSSKGGQWFKHTESYNKIEWMVELVTTSETKTPEFYDFQYVFDEIEIEQ